MSDIPAPLPYGLSRPERVEPEGNETFDADIVLDIDPNEGRPEAGVVPDVPDDEVIDGLRWPASNPSAGGL